MNKLQNIIELRLKQIVVVSIIICSIIVFSCERELKYSEIPEIEYLSATQVKDTVWNDAGYITTIREIVKLVFHFQDGDGDIGLDAADTLHPFNSASEYHYNLMVFPYIKQDGRFVSQETPSPLHVRIPRLTQKEQESIDGEITARLTISGNTKGDTLKYEFYILDRELHKSNVETTSPLVIQ